jgi:nucleoid-associated protein YgaU
LMVRCDVATAGLALTPLWGLLLALAAAMPAAAREPDGHRAVGAGWERGGGSAVWDMPAGWLRHSRENFQRMMHLLAERSARLHHPLSAPDPEPPGPERSEPDSPSAAPGEDERATPEPDGDVPDEPWPAGPPDNRVERRRTAGTDHDRSRTSARDWHKSWSHSCRRAGRAVEGAGWYVVAPGDTLQRIAWLHYGDEGAWRSILHVNGGTISDPNLIYACQRLFIPRPRVGRPRCQDSPVAPVWPVCDRAPPPPVHRGPGGCSRCGAGTHVGEWGWR